MVLETRVKKIQSGLCRNTKQLSSGLELANLTEQNDGNKGVITKIVDTEKPGNDWPTTEDGQQPDVILNPLGKIPYCPV